MKAFIFDPLWDELVTDDLLTDLKESGIELIVTKQIAPLAECKDLFAGGEERILCINPDYVSWKLTNKDYENIPNLKGIFTESTGYEWVEQDVANKKGIPICNVVKFNNESVAEWAIMMMFNLARQTPRLIKNDFPLDFDKDFMKYRGIQLVGKTAGIIGLGNIGTAIAERCKGLGMNVVYWSKNSTNDAFQQVSLKELLSKSDVIFPATAKNEETRSLVSDDMISTIRKEAIIVDIVHNLFNDQLVLDMVKKGELYGYGFEAEPTEFDEYDGNVWAAPAYAWATYESMYNCVVKLVENMVDATNGNFPNKVN